MLTLFHNNQQIILDNTEYYVRELASGLDEVIFDISIWDPNYALMNEEDNIVDRGGQRYLIKQIDAGAVTAKVVAQLDVDEWRASMLVGYNSGTKTCVQQIEAVKPAGWTVSDFAHIAFSRTINGDLTPLQVCEECRNTYKVYVRWNTKDKVCSIYPQALGNPVGSFASRELNLKEINYKGKSQNFATRLYAYGKDGLSFADINDGKPYVDNNAYSSRVICAYWQDDRYTDKSSLLADATENLAKLAVPERSYDCAIVDLQATNPELYNNLDFSLFTTATLIDDIKDVAIDYMVVERHVWPYHPDRNDVIFNSAPIKIQNTVIQIEDELTNPNSTFQQILQAEIDLVTDWLTDNESHCYITQNEDGTIKDFIFVNGDQPIETATQVMRINASGIGFSKTGVNGPFTNAFVFDSVKGGHLVADFITAGTMVADRIRGGTLESINSTTIGGVTYKNFSLNMTTGAIEALKLSIKSANFTLTESGNLTANNAYLTNATVSGVVETTGDGGQNKTKMTGGGIEFIRNGVETGSITPWLYKDNTGRLSVSYKDELRLEYNQDTTGVFIGMDNGGIELYANGSPSGSAIWVEGGSNPHVEIAAEEIDIGTGYGELYIAVNDLYVRDAYGNDQTGWTGVINGVSDGNGHYGDINVVNGIITGWSGW